MRNALEAAEWIDQDAFVPRFNIAPRSYAPVVRRVAANRVLHSMKWGLVPHWTTVEDKSLSTTNARAENLVQGGGMWASIKGKNRCAVICQGYYEWLAKSPKDKRPHFVKHKDGQLMFMAGLYDHATIDGAFVLELVCRQHPNLLRISRSVTLDVHDRHDRCVPLLQLAA